ERGHVLIGKGDGFFTGRATRTTGHRRLLGQRTGGARQGARKHRFCRKCVAVWGYADGPGTKSGVTAHAEYKTGADNRQGKFPPPQKGYKGRFGGNAGPRPEHDLRKRGPAGGGGGAGPLFPPAARPSSPPHARPSEVPPRAVPLHLVTGARHYPP